MRILLALAALALATASSAARPLPDVIYIGGHIAASSGTPTALAVRAGKIVGIGSDATIQSRAGPRTRIVVLGGRTVFPGLYDMHVHPYLAGSGEEGVCSIPQGVVASELLRIVGDCARAATPGAWVTGGQWQAVSLGSTPITAATLDVVSPDNPVMLFDISGHSLWVNSKALAAAGIVKGTPDPDKGIIERDAAGMPTGLLREAARQLVMSKVPPPSAEHVIAGLKASQRLMLSYGITGYVEPFLYREGLAAYAAVSDQGALVQHVQGCMAYSGAGKLNPDLPALIADRARYTRPNFRTDCIKVFADGVPTESHTGAMLADYADSSAGKPPRGLLQFDPATLNPLMADWDRKSLTVVFHAAGDAAVRASLDAIDYARKTNGTNGPMHQIAHSTFVDPADMPRFKALNAAFEASPYLWNPQPINDDIASAVGPARAARAWPLREAFDSGALVIGGSDWAVVPAPDPWQAIETAVTRRTPGSSGAQWGGREAISVREAVAMFTTNAVQRLGTASHSGSLDVGKDADFLILDRDPLGIPMTDIRNVHVLQTVIGGRVVYERPVEPLHVTVYKGGFATVNSYIFSNGKSLVVMDVQRKAAEAEKLAAVVRSMHLPLTHVLISHGHTDHFTGMAVFRHAFPDAQIVVANEAIKRDIKAYAIYMDGFGATAAEPPLDPALKPKSAANPNGFDYENDIHVLTEPAIHMVGGGTLELTTDYLPAEADHATTVYSPDLNALFLADFGYNRVHFWLGDDISRSDIANWRSELLRLKATYAARHPTIYPGHGDPADMALFDRSVRYIDDFLRVTAAATSPDAAAAEMVRLYPDYGQADFFLKYSIAAQVPLKEPK